MNHSTGAVVLGSGHHGGLGIMRSLGRLGVRTYCIAPGFWEPAFTSRYCSGRWVLDIENRTSDECVARLLEIARRIGDLPILIPTTDRGAIWVAENAAALEEGYRFPRQDSSLIRQLADKGRMQELARDRGVPTARSIVPRSKQDVEEFLDSAVFPVMIKATDAARLRRTLGGTKFVVHSAGDLIGLCRKAEDPEQPSFLIQEYIPGEDWMFDGYFDSNSSCVFGVTGKKIRRFPPNTGVTSLGICLRNETVAATTAEFMKAIGYRGILDIGYRYDRRDGRYKVLDVNPRIGCTFRLFTAASGIDVARALYLDMTGQPIPACDPVEGRKWIVEDFDLFSAIYSRRAGALSFKDWMRSLRGIQEAACFAGDDPLPFLAMGLADCYELYHWGRSLISSRTKQPQAATSAAGAAPAAAPELNSSVSCDE